MLFFAHFVQVDKSNAKVLFTGLKDKIQSVFYKTGSFMP